MTPVDGLSPRGPMILGILAAVALFLGFGVWSATVPIDGAVLAVGEVDTAPQRHLVQHSEGGVIAEVPVREGQSVQAGDLLLRLQGGALEQEWTLVTSQLTELRALSLRLISERDGDFFEPPSEAPSASVDWQMAIAAQYRLFLARRDTLRRQVSQLSQRKIQIDAQLQGLAAQDQALATELGLVTQELAIQQELHDRGLTQAARVAVLAREAVRIEGNRAGLLARIAELHGQTAEVDLQIETLRATRREEAEAQLLEAGSQLAALSARHAGLSERRAQLDLRAPAAGIVHGLASLDTGAVLRPAETAMQVVIPVTSPVLALSVRPMDIDHVFLGQSAMVQFPALVRDLPELAATVTAISAAPFVDERTGARHYRVEAALNPEAIAIVGSQALRPGMAVQAFLRTGQRTPLGYLIAPVADQLNRAMRDP